MRFSGDKHMSGFRSLVSRALKMNELGPREENAYRLSNARIGKSGYSYGLNQMDLRNNTVAVTTLDSILRNARDHHIVDLTNDEIEQIKTHVKTSNPNTHPLNARHTEQVNRALSSPIGRLQLERVFSQELNSKMSFVERTILSAVKPEMAVHVTNEVKMLLIDYHNQFNIDNNGPMHRFLKGDEVTVGEPTPTCPNTQAKTLKLNLDRPLNEQVREFIQNTAYGQTYRSDIDRRHGNIDQVLRDAETVPQPIPTTNDTRIADEIISKYGLETTDVTPEDRKALANAVIDVATRYRQENESLPLEIPGVSDGKKESNKIRNELTIEHVKQVFFFMEDIASATGNRTLGKIAQFGGRSIALFENVSKLSNVSFSLASFGEIMAWVQPTGAVISAAFALFSLLNNEGSNAEIQAIEQMIHELRSFIAEQFERVFAGLEVIFNSIQTLREEILINFQIPTLESLARIEAKIDFLTSYLKEALNEIYFQEIRATLFKVKENSIDLLDHRKEHVNDLIRYIKQKLLVGFLTQRITPSGSIGSLELDIINQGKLDRALTQKGDVPNKDDSFDILSEDFGYVLSVLSPYEEGFKRSFPNWQFPHFALWYTCISSLLTLLSGMSADEMTRFGYVSKLREIKEACQLHLNNLRTLVQVNPPLANSLLNYFLSYIGDLQVLRRTAFIQYLGTQVTKSRHNPAVELFRARTFQDLYNQDEPVELTDTLKKLKVYRDLLVLYARFARFRPELQKTLANLLHTFPQLRSLPVGPSIVKVDSIFKKDQTAKIPFYRNLQTCRMKVVLHGKVEDRVATAYLDGDNIVLGLLNPNDQTWEMAPTFPSPFVNFGAIAGNPYPQLETFNMIPVRDAHGRDVLYFANIQWRGSHFPVIEIRSYDQAHRYWSHVRPWLSWHSETIADGGHDPLHIAKEQAYTRSWRFISGIINGNPCIISVVIANYGLGVRYFDTVTKTFSPGVTIAPGFAGTNNLHVSPAYFETLQIFFAFDRLYVLCRNSAYVQGCTYRFDTGQVENLPKGPALSNLRGYSHDAYFKTMKYFMLNDRIHLLIRNSLGIALYRLDSDWIELFDLHASEEHKKYSPSWNDQDFNEIYGGEDYSDGFFKMPMSYCLDAKPVKINGYDWLALAYHKKNKVLLYLYDPRAASPQASWYPVEVPYTVPASVSTTNRAAYPNRVKISLSAVKSNDGLDDLVVTILTYNKSDELVASSGRKPYTLLDSFVYQQKLSPKPISHLEHIRKEMAAQIDELNSNPNVSDEMRPMCQIEAGLRSQVAILDMNIANFLNRPQSAVSSHMIVDPNPFLSSVGVFGISNPNAEVLHSRRRSETVMSLATETESHPEEGEEPPRVLRRLD